MQNTRSPGGKRGKGSWRRRRNWSQVEPSRGESSLSFSAYIAHNVPGIETTDRAEGVAGGVATRGRVLAFFCAPFCSFAVVAFDFDSSLLGYTICMHNAAKPS